MHSNFISKLTKVADQPGHSKSRQNSLDQPSRSRSTRSRSSTRESIRSFKSSSTSVSTMTTVPSLPTTSTKYRSSSFSLTNTAFTAASSNLEHFGHAALSRGSTATTIAKTKSPLGTSWRVEGNRRFHDIPGSNYPLPSDDEEMDRIQTQHYLLRFSFEHNMTAPVQTALYQGAKVLDVGCAAGTWMLELATEYPNSQFHGIDIHPAFPELVKPQNCHFHLCNILNGLPWHNGHFDYVHMRFMACALSEQQWSLVVKELIRVTKPGGYVELFESETAPRRVGPQSSVAFKQINFALQARNIDINSPFRLGSFLDTQGLVGVKYDFSSMPIAWGGRAGDCQKENFMALMRSMKPWLAKSLAYSDNKYDSLMPVILEECAQQKSYVNYHYAYGMVPVTI